MSSVESSRTIERAYRMRAYPTRAQRALLGRLFGAARFVWNWALSARTAAYRERGESINWIALSRQFTALKQQDVIELEADTAGVKKFVMRYYDRMPDTFDFEYLFTRVDPSLGAEKIPNFSAIWP